MNVETGLSNEERELLLDLLLRERRELPPEIHHTRNRETHEALSARFKVVKALIERLEKTPAVT